MYQPADIARVVHEANRALQIVNGDPVSERWDDLDAETRASAVDGVRNALTGATPEESHENWTRFKVEHGWVYGPVKDPEAKTHPCLVPYADLPADQRIKDHLFTVIVNTLG